jgi:hypothetical protein
MAEAEHDRHQAEERLSDLFEPDILLPVQYFAALKRKRFSCGEHRLLVAIMQDAIECFQKHLHARDSKRRQLYIEAEAWIGAEEDDGTFSFDNVCDLLGMNPDYLRQGLLAWRDRERARHRARLMTAVRTRPDGMGEEDDPQPVFEDMLETIERPVEHPHMT